MIDTSRPLHDDVAEQGILGAILCRPEAFEDLSLSVEDFHWNNHQLIFGAMEAIVKDGGEPDAMTVNAHLQQTKKLVEAGGSVKLWELVRDASFGLLIPQHAEILKELGRLRGLKALSMNIELQLSGGMESNKIAAATEHAIDALYSAQMGGKWASMENVTKESLEKIDAAYSGKALIGVPTGLKALDRMLGGLQKSDLVIVAGRPSMGKTSLSLQFADAAAKGGFKVGIVSLEMSNTQVANRLLAMNADGLSVESLQRGTLTAMGWSSLTTAASSVSGLPIYLCDDSACTLAEIKAKAKTLQRTNGLDLLIVDYLQLMEGDGRHRNREGDISHISRGLKQVAKRLHVPVVALSQLSRRCDERPDKRPIMSDLRESGAIEQDADVILMIYRDEVYDLDTPDKGMAELLIRKHRNGPIGDVRVGWVAEKTLFTNELEGV